MNNNFPLAANIVVGDVPANTVVNGNTLSNVGMLQITATGTSGVSGFALSNNHFRRIRRCNGQQQQGLNIGQTPAGATVGTIASNADPVPGTPATTIGNNPIGTNSVISPGSVTGKPARVLLNSGYNANDPMYGPVVYGLCCRIADRRDLEHASWEPVQLHCHRGPHVGQRHEHDHQPGRGRHLLLEA